MKALLIIPALLLGATSVSAGVDSDFGQVPVSIDRSGAASIRSCAEEFGGDYTAVCYNQTTTVAVGERERATERVVRVRCDVPRATVTTRGAVAAEFCPQVRAGILAPAPFLL
jgi:hypothetical protein